MTLTAKEKAKELVDRFIPHTNSDWDIEIEQAKQCALISLDEMLDDDVYDMSHELFMKRIEYLEEVKSEIVKL